MPLDARFVGRSYPPTGEPYEVGREKIREFADAIGDPNPAYRDPAAAQKLGHPDVIAPPTFVIVVSLPAAQEVVSDPELGLDWSRVVHGDQRFVHTRPVRAGDRLAVTTFIDDVKTMAGNDIITMRAAITSGDASGELITTAYSTLVARGPEEG